MNAEHYETEYMPVMYHTIYDNAGEYPYDYGEMVRCLYDHGHRMICITTEKSNACNYFYVIWDVDDNMQKTRVIAWQAGHYDDLPGSEK